MSYLLPGSATRPKAAPRERTKSHMDFRQSTTVAAVETLKQEIHRQVQSAHPSKRQAFAKEMESFTALFDRYIKEKASGEKIEWDRIRPPTAQQVVGYNDLPEPTPEEHKELLKKLVVLKLNGGLGTTMGMSGAPKSAIEVRDGMTFLDLTVRQIESLNKPYENEFRVPLYLMNSFNTDADTQRIIQKYAGRVPIETFNQSRFPRVNRETLLPVPRSEDSDKSQWYPPGHGDIFDALHNSGHLQQLVADGKEYIFVSNVDNLGADVDLRILKHFVESKSEFLMELTDKTKADVKGGTLINYETTEVAGGKKTELRLLEIAQVPSEHVEDFKSVNKFKVFNTNNLWMNLHAIQEKMNDRRNKMELDIIVNNKVADDGTPVIQLETAVGAAIKHFNAHGVNVPRSRFLPVKSCSDLLLITSDLYSLQHGKLVMNPDRLFGQTPVVKLGDDFKKIANFQKRFRTIPHILELDHLTVSGDVWFGRGITLRGTVIIVANKGSRIDLPDGAILENKLVSGNVSIIDH